MGLTDRPIKGTALRASARLAWLPGLRAPLRATGLALLHLDTLRKARIDPDVPPLRLPPPDASGSP